MSSSNAEMIDSGHSDSEPEGLQRVRDVAVAPQDPQPHILVGQRKTNLSVATSLCFRYSCSNCDVCRMRESL
jgi:hypothetical protein